MNFSMAPPPGISSGALRILTTDFPEEGQSAMAYLTEAPEPTYPTASHRSSLLQLQSGGQRAVPADVVLHSPPEQTDLRIVGHSTNNLSVHDNRAPVEHFGGGSLTDLVPKIYSGYGLDDYYGDGEGPRISGFNLRPQSIIGPSTDNIKFDPLATKNTMSGKPLRDAYDEFNKLNEDEEDWDFDD
ncbi:hypothetical protein L2E82_11111 [Cichorium intybus]|uniref:Uncharacterized protein n=1 Tax=Cichorium intybus TaxID=13427 RepID=A0ACB9GCF9_CICIN|nr:hypothetical protein L2E82_11111 [Cichorium intybus]